MKDFFSTAVRLGLVGTALSVGVLGESAIANSGCYVRYSGQSQDLQTLCGGEGEEARLELRQTLPVVQNVAMDGDFAQGRMLLGEVHNPHGYTSDGVTLFYAVHTSEEVRTGTLVISSLAAYDTTQVTIDLTDLRGMVERYDIDIL